MRDSASENRALGTRATLHVEVELREENTPPVESVFGTGRGGQYPLQGLVVTPEEEFHTLDVEPEKADSPDDSQFFNTGDGKVLLCRVEARTEVTHRQVLLIALLS